MDGFVEATLAVQRVGELSRLRREMHALSHLLERLAALEQDLRGGYGIAGQHLDLCAHRRKRRRSQDGQAQLVICPIRLTDE